MSQTFLRKQIGQVTKFTWFFFSYLALTFAVLAFNAVYGIFVSNINGFHGTLNTTAFILGWAAVALTMIYAFKRERNRFKKQSKTT